MMQDNWFRICLPGAGKGRLQFGATRFVGAMLVIIRVQSAGFIKFYMVVFLSIIGNCVFCMGRGVSDLPPLRDGWGRNLEGGPSQAILSM